MVQDVPSAIDLRQMDDARAWASKAGQRPGRDEMLDRIAQEVERQSGPSPFILELGSGPGVLAQRILQRIAEADYTALDFSPAMHLLARERLRALARRVTFLERSFKADSWTKGLPSFDFVVTNQAVHELRHKSHAQELHRQVHGLLKQDGCYLVSDHFSGPGGLPNAELYMTISEQRDALSAAGFITVEPIFTTGSLALHLARKD